MRSQTETSLLTADLGSYLLLFVSGLERWVDLVDSGSRLETCKQRHETHTRS